jgi:hypothetical protein
MEHPSGDLTGYSALSDLQGQKTCSENSNRYQPNAYRPIILIGHTTGQPWDSQRKNKSAVAMQLLLIRLTIPQTHIYIIACLYSAIQMIYKLHFLPNMFYALVLPVERMRVGRAGVRLQGFLSRARYNLIFPSTIRFLSCT